MNGYTLLIVDDDPTTHEILGEYLSRAGYQVEHAYNGRQGVEMVQAITPDVVLLDVQMPEMDGFQAMETLRRSGEELTPVIFLTSLALSHLKVKGLELGAEDYITKPFNKAEILSRVKTVLRRTGRYRRISGSLNGRLNDISLPELLQTLELGRKTGRVTFPDMNGEITLVEGRIVTANMERHQGAEAVCRLFLLNRGGFSVDFSIANDDVPQGEGRSIQQVLMDTARQVDEIRRNLDVFPTGNPLIEASETPADDAELLALLPMPLYDLLVSLPGKLQATSQKLIDALQANGVVALTAEIPPTDSEGASHG
ncbi:MAG: hypothetical protein C0621_06975 [Desulfuromonas sp.]|nr:MAG: hypothetical protein C0621_06975 [Desulfuromonas sp.]